MSLIRKHGAVLQAWACLALVPGSVNGMDIAAKFAEKNNCGAMVKRLLAGSFGSCVLAYLLLGPVFYTLRRYVNYVLLKMLHFALVRSQLL